MDTGWRGWGWWWRGLEGQAEVLAHHPQTRGSHGEGVAVTVQTSELVILGSKPISYQLCSLAQVN